MKHYDTILVFINIYEHVKELNREGFFTMRESLEASVAVALRRMGFILSDQMEMLSRVSIPNVTEASYYLEEDLFESLNTLHTVVDIEVRNRYLLVIHQVRKKHGLP